MVGEVKQLKTLLSTVERTDFDGKNQCVEMIKETLEIRIR